MVQNPTLQSERWKPQKADERHFKDFPATEERDRVDPFPPGPKIPELPHQTTGQPAQEQAPDSVPVSGRYRQRKAADAELFQQRIQEKDGSKPDRREKEAGRNHWSHAQEQSKNQEKRRGGRPGRRPERFKFGSGRSISPAENQSLEQI